MIRSRRPSGRPKRWAGMSRGRVIADDPERARRFHEAALPHLGEAYARACHFLHNFADAEDAVQESYLRAFQYFDGFCGSAFKPWLMAILRNVCRRAYTRRIALSSAEPRTEVADDDESDPDESDAGAPLWQEPSASPEIEVQRRTDGNTMRRLLAAMPDLFREVLILRDVNELSYRDIAKAIGVPVGTVMSRLARARAMLRDAWLAAEKENGGDDL
jgi:RNA polymerase sigma-70 factor (ECF subfamily)